MARTGPFEHDQFDRAPDSAGRRAAFFRESPAVAGQDGEPSRRIDQEAPGALPMNQTLEASTQWRDRFDRDGVAIIDSVLAPGQVAQLIELTRGCASHPREGVLERGGEVYGVRDLIWRIPEIRRLAESPELLEIVEDDPGTGGRCGARAVFRQDPDH